MTQRPKAPTSNQAQELAQLIHSRGDYAHITVRNLRGHLVIYADPAVAEPVARCTPLHADQYGLSFRRHTGQWERTPFTGNLGDLAETLVTSFGVYLDRREFLGRIGGSDH